MKSVNENIPVISLLWKCILHLYLDYCIIIPFFGGGGRGEWRGIGLLKSCFKLCCAGVREF